VSAPFRLALCALLLAPAASFAEDVEPPSSAKADARRMAGTYRVVSYEHDGAALPPQQLKTMKVVLDKDGNGTFFFDGGATSSRITLLPNKKPKQVDCVYTDGPLKGKTIKGIYQIDRDGFRCCYAAVGGERPAKFESPRGSRMTLYVIERMKEK
jgi:uncharacterized protein (TIGR03067 family)